MLACPSCFRQMRCITESDVQIDVCDGCGSVWCDPGELNAIATSPTTEFGEPKSKDIESCKLQCPRCNHNDFCEVRFNAVVLNRCNGCGGVSVSSDTLDRLKTMAKKDKKPKAKPRKRTKPTNDSGTLTGNAAVDVVADVTLGGCADLLFSILFSL